KARAWSFRTRARCPGWRSRAARRSRSCRPPGTSSKSCAPSGWLSAGRQGSCLAREPSPWTCSVNTLRRRGSTSNSFSRRSFTRIRARRTGAASRFCSSTRASARCSARMRTPASCLRRCNGSRRCRSRLTRSRYATTAAATIRRRRWWRTSPRSAFWSPRTARPSVTRIPRRSPASSRRAARRRCASTTIPPIASLGTGWRYGSSTATSWSSPMTKAIWSSGCRAGSPAQLPCFTAAAQWYRTGSIRCQGGSTRMVRSFVPGLLSLFVAFPLAAQEPPPAPAVVVHDEPMPAAEAGGAADWAPDLPEPGSVEKIKEYTTAPEFLPESVAYVPDSATVPSPTKVLGHLVGAPDELSRVADVHGYLRKLAAASDRVKVLSIGTSEEGREMTLVLVSDAQNLADLDHFKD